MAFYSYPFESKNTGTPTDPIYDRAITAEDERHFNKLRYKNVSGCQTWRMSY